MSDPIHQSKMYPIHHTLNVIKSKKTPIIEEFLSESQMGFRKGRGTSNAIFQLRTICERSLEFGKTVYLCFIDYQKAFDMVKHDKLVEAYEENWYSGVGNWTNY